MPLSTFMIIVGLMFFALGLAKISSGHDTGLDLNNYGFDIFNTNRQSIEMRAALTQAPETDWVSLVEGGFGLISAGIGLTIALFDWLKS